MSAPTVFITGAAAGIGRATALTFARHGYRVGAYDIDLAGLASLRDEITGHGGDVVIGSSTSPTPRNGPNSSSSSPGPPAGSTSWSTTPAS